MERKNSPRLEHALCWVFIALLLMLTVGCAREQFSYPVANTAGQASQQPEQHTKDSGIDKTYTKLVVATTADYPPFEFEVDGQLVGFDIELIEYIGKRTNAGIDLRDMDFESALRAVAEGRADMAIAAIQPTEDRAEDMDFSHEYYVPGRQCVLVAEQNADAITSKQALDGAAVACMNGDVAMALLTKDTDAQLLRADDEQAAVEMLLTGEADAAAVSWIIGRVMCLQYEQLHMSDIDLGDVRIEGICVAVRKGDDALLKTVNTIIDDAIRLKLPDRWMENAIRIMAESPVQY